jgi:tetratricopeptide (TPR) repeat protein
MLALSRYWGTLGFVYYRQGQQQKAEAFTRAAWELNPNELFCSHLGRIYEAQLRPKDALAFYRMALNTRVTGAEQDLLLTRLARLGEPNPQPLGIDVTSPLPLLNLHSEQNDINPLVDILLKHGELPAVTLIQGNAALTKPLTLAIQSALANSLPDTGPEKILRRAQVSCTTTEKPACSLHFIGSVEAMNATATPSASPASELDHKATTQ